MLYTVGSYSQDSIVNYLDKKGKIVAKKEAISFEIITKKDSLWKVTRYYRNGKIRNYGYFKSKDKKIAIGQFISYHRNGNPSRMIPYDLNGNKSGRFKSWFDNKRISITGIYLDDKKEGIWSYKYFSGIESCRNYYSNDSIVKTVLYNTTGDIVDEKLIEYRKPQFKGGMNRFNNKIKKLANNINYNVNGKIYVNFKINLNGDISDVSIDEIIPEELKNQIVSYFEKIEGWQPAIHMNRLITTSYSIPLSFKK